MSFAQTYGPQSTARTASLAPRAYGAPASGPHASPAARYRDAELASATPGQLVVMLYDRLLLTVRRAKLGCEMRDIEMRTVAVGKATDMLTELRGSLDFAQGGNIARELDALYVYMLRELSGANRTQDATKLDIVLHMAGELRDAFAQIVAGNAGALPQARSA